MSESTEIQNLGIPVPVDPETIERELKSLWESAHGQEGGTTMVRACSCNLIVLVRDRDEAAAILPILARVSEWHPHRALVAYATAGAADGSATSPFQAWLGAQCAVPSAGGLQVCSESITVEARGETRKDLPNVVSALMVPDLPVYFYWRSFRESDLELAAFLARYATVLVADSHASTADVRGRDGLLELLLGWRSGLAVRDLNWERLTAWRDVLAQFFDPEPARPYAHRITEVEIRRAIAAPGSIPTRTLLLTGWLASRLGWVCRSARRHRDCWTSSWAGPAGEVAVSFTGNVAGAVEPPGITSVTLRTASGAAFSAVLERDAGCIVATSEGAGTDFVHSVSEPALDEASLLARELSLPGEDADFQAALAEALRLERRFRE